MIDYTTRSPTDDYMIFLKWNRFLLHLILTTTTVWRMLHESWCYMQLFSSSTYWTLTYTSVVYRNPHCWQLKIPPFPSTAFIFQLCNFSCLSFHVIWSEEIMDSPNSQGELQPVYPPRCRSTMQMHNGRQISFRSAAGENRVQSKPLKPEGFNSDEIGLLFRSRT